jgi:glycerophosphoryl diester phosphodiesterase
MPESLIFAHRGANTEAAENTREAFDKALVHGIDGMETDVQLSRDGVAVLWHDRLLNKIGLPDQQIDDFDFAQLQAMNFSVHFSPTAKPQGIMSLQEYLDAYRNRCILLIEIKNREWEQLGRHQTKVRLTLDMLGTQTPGDPPHMASSFNLASLIYANQYKPGIPLIYNLEEAQTLAEAKQVLAEQPFLHGLCLPIASLNEDMVKLLRDSGKCIAVYTCNSHQEISKALNYEVDIVISDVPDFALQMRDVGTSPE